MTVCEHSFSDIHEVACNRLTNIDGKACNNIPEVVNKLGWNKHDSSYYSKQNSKFYHSVKF